MRDVFFEIFRVARIGLLGALVVAPLAVGTSTAHASTTKSAELLGEGVEHLEQGRYRRAIKAFEAADKLESGGSADALVGLSRAFNGLGDFKSARSHAQRGIEAAKEPTLRIIAHGELAYAIARGPIKDRSAAEMAIKEIRRYLTTGSSDDFANAMRARLCSVRHTLEWAYGPGGEAIELEEDDETYIKPQLIVSTQPVPPRGMGMRIDRQTVKSRLLIDADGCVTSVEVVEATTSMWAEAVKASAMNWVYQPAQMDGKPVPVFSNVTTESR